LIPSTPRSLLVFGFWLAIAGLWPGEPALAQKATESHWAFRAPQRPELPEVKASNWVRNPVDRFILGELEAIEFRPAPEADRVALLRRVTYDLTGLPPSPEEIDRFVNDPRPDAYDRVVDRLLDSPQYGERQAQHWLDLAHHADSNGFELDAERPDAWRYRDWVVRAFNQDMPYDRFVTLQLAGDEAEPGDTDALIATGFGRGGPREVVGGNIDPKVKRQSELTEITGTVGSVFLGLTIACARCHDHKFDPLPAADYYALQACFAGAQLVEIPIADKAEIEAYDAAKKAVEAKVAPLKRRKAEIEAPYRETLKKAKEASLTPLERELMAIPKKDRTPAQKRLVEGLSSALMVRWEEIAEAVAKDPVPHAEREKIKREIEAIENTLPRPPAHAQALIDPKPEAPETFILRRGEVTSPGPKVEPGPPGILRAVSTFDPQTIQATATTTGRRLALARWLTRPDHPLTARVIVNRVWQNHYGRGIVATPSDFGVRGEAPTHPALLDWLATELVAQGWKLKPMHRLMVISAAYRQASTDRSEVGKKQSLDDPENNFLGRMNRRRLDAEGVRDAMLSVSGEINLKAGGPGVLVPIEPEIESLIFTEAEVVDLWPETVDPLEQARRSLYLFRKRNVRYALFDAFDAPDTQSACPKRVVSTHALQALALLNSDFAAGRARALAGRVFRESGGDDSDRIARIYKVVLGRDPRPAETERDRGFLTAQADLLRRRLEAGPSLDRPTFTPEGMAPSLAAAWVDYARAMLNRNEFLYVP